MNTYDDLTDFEKGETNGWTATNSQGKIVLQEGNYCFELAERGETSLKKRFDNLTAGQTYMLKMDGRSFTYYGNFEIYIQDRFIMGGDLPFEPDWHSQQLIFDLKPNTLNDIEIKLKRGALTGRSQIDNIYLTEYRE